MPFYTREAIERVVLREVEDYMADTAPEDGVFDRKRARLALKHIGKRLVDTYGVLDKKSPFFGQEQYEAIQNYVLRLQMTGDLPESIKNHIIDEGWEDLVYCTLNWHYPDNTEARVACWRLFGVRGQDMPTDIPRGELA